MKTASKDVSTRLHEALEMLKTECNVSPRDVLGVTILETGYMALRLTADAYLNVSIHQDARPITITDGHGSFDYLTFRNISIYEAY
jgi:hypothetical protein